MTPLLPAGLPAFAAVALLGALAIRRVRTIGLIIALGGFAGSFFAALAIRPAASAAGHLFTVDSYSLFFVALMGAIGFAISLLSSSYLARFSRRPEEFYLLVLLATFGCNIIATSAHFVSFFLGLDLLSVSLYGLIAYLRERETCLEAGIKYLILAAASTAFLLLGIAWVYARLGTLTFADLIVRLSGGNADAWVLAGLGLVLVGFGFKLAWVPFHMWTPDVYQGAPAPVTAFIATASKTAMLALLLRFGLMLELTPGSSLWLFLALVSAASMIAGNLLALRQQNLKRLLAYSSIAHQGYLLVALLVGGDLAGRTLLFYVVAYAASSLAAFGVITVLSPANSTDSESHGTDRDRLDNYRDLSRRHPWLAAILTASILSLAGIPLTAGFIGKLLIVEAGVSGALWALVIILALSSAIGIYYYLRVLVELYARPEGEGPDAEQEPQRPAAVSAVGGAVLVVISLTLIWLGVLPGGLLSLIDRAVSSVVF